MCSTSSRSALEWDLTYRTIPLSQIPWQSSKPPLSLVYSISKFKVKSGKALDVCCGAGTNSLYLARKGFSVSGIDISSKAIQIAKQRAEKAVLSIDFKVGDVLDFPYPSSSFNLVVDRGCFHHIKPELREKFVNGIARVLKKNGYYYLQAFSNVMKLNYGYTFSKQDIRNYFGEKFKILRWGQAVHFEPSGGKVVLRTAFMRKV